MDALKSFSAKNRSAAALSASPEDLSQTPSNQNGAGVSVFTRAAPKPKWWRSWCEGPRLFLFLILAAFTCFLWWISVAEIDRVVRVEGKIVPAGRAQQVQHYEGGIVASILAHEGNYVKKGDILLTIDNTSADATLNESTGKLDHYRLRAARLEAESKNEAAIRFPPALTKTDGAEAERILFSSRREKFLKEVQVHQEMIRQHTQALKDSETRREKLAGELVVAKKRSGIVENMAARRAASQMELLDAQSRERRIETEITEAENAKPKLTGAISEERARIEAITAEFRSKAQDDLVATLAEIERLQHVVTAEADRVKRTEVRAPIDGVINRLSVNTVGGVIKPGESLIEITPNTDAALIEAKALPRDRGELKPDLMTKVRVSAYDAAEFGTLTGKVSEISADTVQDSRGDPYYRVKVLVTKLPVAYTHKPLLPGMTVTGDVVTGRRTILHHILSPLRKFTNNMFRDSR